MPHTTRPIAESDTPALTELFNFFITNSFAAYPSIPTDSSIYRRLKESAGDLPFYAVDDADGKFIGIALLRKFHPADTMKHVAEVTVFLSPDQTHTGIGSEILQQLETEARARGITILMASASSRNEPSLKFQQRNGFVECGRFKRVGKKFGEEYDMVWMQKFLD
ncbi:MAG: N-acetyltransferase family protein [Candidatus Zixiibacteriota bacterium]